MQVNSTENKKMAISLDTTLTGNKIRKKILSQFFRLLYKNTISKWLINRNEFLWSESDEGLILK